MAYFDVMLKDPVQLAQNENEKVHLVALKISEKELNLDTGVDIP
jgi:hypothetical protein